MADATTVIGSATRVQGRLTGEVDVDVRGMVKGDITVGGEVTVDSGGMVDGNVTARTLVVRGAVKGDLLGVDAVLLEDGARVVGDVRAPRVAIASGALLRGLVEADPGEGPPVQSAREQAARLPSPTREIAASRTAAPPRRPALKAELGHAAGLASAVAYGSSDAAPPARPASPQPAATAGAEATHHAGGARRPPPPVLPALKRGRGQIVKKKER